MSPSRDLPSPATRTKWKFVCLIPIKSAAALAELKNLGFEVIANPGEGMLYIGRIAASKLSLLAALPSVQHVTLR